MLGVNLAEPLAKEWSFAADLRREAGAAFKINGEAPTWTPDKQIPTASTVAQAEVSPDSGVRRSGDIDGSAHGSQNAATTSTRSATAQAPEGLEGPNETPPIHANDELKAPPPPTKTAIAPAMKPLDGPPADAAKKRYMDKQAKADAQRAQDLKTTTPGKKPPKRIPKKKKKNSKKPTGAGSAGADSKPKSTALPISEDTTMLVKQSLREYYWQKVKVREVILVSRYFVSIKIN